MSWRQPWGMSYLTVAEKAGVGERLGYWQDVAKGSPTLPHSRYLLPPELRHM